MYNTVCTLLFKFTLTYMYIEKKNEKASKALRILVGLRRYVVPIFEVNSVPTFGIQDFSLGLTLATNPPSRMFITLYLFSELFTQPKVLFFRLIFCIMTVLSRHLNLITFSLVHNRVMDFWGKNIRNRFL